MEAMKIAITLGVFIMLIGVVLPVDSRADWGSIVAGLLAGGFILFILWVL